MATEARYGINLGKDVPVAMRDGTHQATDIYRPAHDGNPLPGPFPTILCRTPYDKTERRYTEIADFFTPRGYVLIIQDLRGRYRSEGVGQYYHVANDLDGPDGYDTIEWIAAQPWSNGKVGMVGSSFAGLVQTRAALLRPPHLTTIWPDVSPTNSYFHQAREGGAMQLQMFWALFMHAHDAPEIRDEPEKQQVVWDGLRDLRKWLVSTPFVPGKTPLAVVPNLEQTLFEYYYRGAHDDYWKRECNDFERYYDRHADIPGTFTVGWYDAYCPAMSGQFAAMQKQSQSPQRLIIGPWNHVAMRGDTSFVGDVDFGKDSVWGVQYYFEEQLRWFERWLRDSANVVERDPPVRIFVMGGGDGHRTPEGKYFHGGQWRSEQEWPLRRALSQKLYLRSGGGLTESLPPANESSRTYTFDPNHPVPTLGGSLCGIMELPPDNGDLDAMWKRFQNPVTRLRHMVTTGPCDQKEDPSVFAAQAPYPPLSARPDVLVFQTEPLTQPLEVTGPITVELWISSTAVDTDFTAKLIDVCPSNADYPNGYAFNLVDSIIRTRFRNSWEREELMQPGTIYPVRISLPPTSNVFMPGHRIRIDISSSNFPRLDLNPNTGEPLGRHTRMQTADNTVYLDADHPSHVVLPVIPAATS